MKRFFIILGGLLFITLASAVAFAGLNSGEKSKVVPLENVITLKETVNADRPMVVLFYADWCTYCIKFMPTYKMLGDLYKNSYNFIMLNVDAPANKPLMDEVGITGLPTVYIIDKKYDNRFMISNSIYGNIKKLRIELDRYLRIRTLLDSK